MPSPASRLSGETADGERTATIIDGRGRAGKTTVANVFVQFCRQRGADLQVWNADRQNETHSLSVFHRDAIRPPSDDPDDKGVWLEESFDTQAHERFDPVRDLAGGDPLVRLLARETELVPTLERCGIRIVLWTAAIERPRRRRILPMAERWMQRPGRRSSNGSSPR
jgi:hypothetical protein